MVITSRTRNAVVLTGHVGSNPTVSANENTVPSDGFLMIRTGFEPRNRKTAGNTGGQFTYSISVN